jgi:tRNA A-37 threonylcarbamoyl transferase component Bud32
MSWEEHIHELVKASQAAAEQGDQEAKRLLRELGPDAEGWLLRSGNSLFLLEEFKPKPASAAGVAGDPITGVGGPLPTRLGRFEILRELGRGGGGVVFLAVDPFRADRVALKVPRPEILIEAKGRRRFLREAQAMETLDHPAIIRVLEVGQIGLICYIVSAYCEGPNLSEWLADRDGPVDPRGAAALVASLAEGVAHAHAQGILHRDIKPSNVLLSSAPGGCEGLDIAPKLLDFGMAKLLEGPSDDVSQSGTVVGTARYMAPEQAAAVRGSVSERLDVYALGAVLYELLAGRPPYDVNTLKELLNRLAHGEPTPPRRIRPEISLDLETIVLRCLEKNPRRRCAGAGELARNLRLFLDGRPIELRRPSCARRIGCWVRQKPGRAIGVSLVAAAIGLVAAAIGLVYLGHSLTGRDWPVRPARPAIGDYAAELRAAAAYREGERFDQARALLLNLRPRTGESDHREFAWYHLWRQGPPSRTLVPPAKIAGHRRLCFSPDSRFLAIVGDALALWDLKHDRILDAPQNLSVRPSCVVFSLDGAKLAAADRDGSIKVWTTADKTILLDDPGRRATIIGLCFSTDGRLLFASSDDGRLWSWDLTTGRPRPTPNQPVERSEIMLFAPDGKLTVSVADDALIYRDAGAGRQLWKVHEGSPILSLAADSDWTTIASGHKQGEIILRDASTGELRSQSHNQSGPVRVLALSADGRTLASAGWGPSVTLWDARTKRKLLDKLLDLEGPGQEIACLGFAPDNQWLAAAGPDGTLRIWAAPRRGADDSR